MPVRFNQSHPAVESNRNRLAVTRGPLVYCAEGIDQGFPLFEHNLSGLFREGEAQIAPILDGTLRNLLSIKLFAGTELSGDHHSSTLTLIPYFAWNNRGNGTMRIWFPY